MDARGKTSDDRGSPALKQGTVPKLPPSGGWTQASFENGR